MVKSNQHNNHGGRREGAGRPTLSPKGAVRGVKFMLRDDHVAVLDRAARDLGVGRSEILRDLIERLGERAKARRNRGASK